MLCRNCQKGKAHKAGGLCWRCYNTPGVRERFPAREGNYGRLDVAADFNGPGATPVPTSALPGTPEKIAVLEERARLGQALFHPLDADGERGGLVA